MATAKLRLDTRPKSNGLHNVKVAIYHKSDKKFFGTTVDISKADFNQVNEAIKGNINLRKDDKIKVKDILQGRIKEAQAICEKLGNRFSFNSFTELYTDTKVKNDSIEYLFDQLIQSKYNTGNIGTAKSYNNAKQSLLKFSKKATIQDVTVSFLDKYETYMKANNRSRTTIGIYLRPLRAIYNQAIDSSLIDRSQNPFSRRRYQIPTGKGRKLALEPYELKKLEEFKPRNEAEQRALDFFFISYYANGINFKDIALMRKSQFHQNEITFQRSKTKNKDPRFIHVAITKPLKHLIDRNKIHKLEKDHYVFNILNENEDLRAQDAKIRQFIKTTNKYLKRISEVLELSTSVTTYTARHTFISIAVAVGHDSRVVQDLVGHSDLRSTEVYIADVAKEKREESTQKIANYRALING